MQTTTTRDGLAGARRGSRWRLVSGSTLPAERLRLAHSGVRPGAEVIVLQCTGGGGRVLAVGTYRLALDRATLSRLRAEPLA